MVFLLVFLLVFAILIIIINYLSALWSFVTSPGKLRKRKDDPPPFSLDT